jgi:hypothetical protein
LADPAAQWYVRPPNGNRYGPTDGVTIKQWIREGRVTRTTLLWRDGWAQWRDCDDIIPEAFAAEPEAVDPTKAPPQIATGPAADFGASGAAGVYRRAPGAAGSAKKSDVDSYLGTKRRRRARRRLTLIVVLAGVAVILVVALVVALLWSG